MPKGCPHGPAEGAALDGWPNARRDSTSPDGARLTAPALVRNDRERSIYAVFEVSDLDPPRESVRDFPLFNIAVGSRKCARSAGAN